MNNKQDKELVQLIQDVVDGKVQKKELCNKIYKEVYALSYPVYRDEEKSMTQAKKALIQVCNKINSIDLTKNIHKQIAVIVSTYFFENTVDENSKELSENTDIKEYKFSRIREDEELLTYMKKKANAFRSPSVFDDEDKELKSLNSVQMALVELYAYEMQSVDAIERMTEVDSSYIGSWIAQIKAVLSGEEVVKAEAETEADKAAVIDNNATDETYADSYENTDDDKEQYDEEENGESEDDEDNNEYEEQEAVSSVYQKRHGHRENAVTLFIRRLFPALSLPARLAISWVAGCIVVIALVSVLFVSVIAGKNNKKKVNKDYDYRDMQYYTTKQPTTKQTNTTAGSTAAEQTEGNTTENNTTQTERRENTQEETQRATAGNNEEARGQQEESSAEESSSNEQPVTDESESTNEETPSQQPSEEQSGEEPTTEQPTTEPSTEEKTTDEEKTTEAEKTTSGLNDDKQDRQISNENSDNN